MTLPSSGPLTLDDIAVEFDHPNAGLGGAIPLQDFYAGGAYVPAGTTGDGGPIPTSGAIDIFDFYGAQNGFTMVAGFGSQIGQANSGYSIVPGLPVIGSLNPDTFQGVQCLGVYWNNFSTATDFNVYFNQTNLGQSWFTQVLINGPGYNNVIYTTASAALYNGNIGGDSLWRWNFGSPLTNGETYTVVFS